MLSHDVSIISHIFSNAGTIPVCHALLIHPYIWDSWIMFQHCAARSLTENHHDHCERNPSISCLKRKRIMKGHMFFRTHRRKRKMANLFNHRMKDDLVTDENSSFIFSIKSSKFMRFGISLYSIGFLGTCLSFSFRI